MILNPYKFLYILFFNTFLMYFQCEISSARELLLFDFDNILSLMIFYQRFSFVS